MKTFSYELAGCKNFVCLISIMLLMPHIDYTCAVRASMRQSVPTSHDTNDDDEP